MELTLEQFYTIMTVYISVMVFLFGTIIGSFLNVLIYRLPIGMKFKKGSSICTTCGHKLIWKDLFPLFSWLFLRGKCRYCKAPISVRYPVVEATNAVLYVLAYNLICGGNALSGLSLALAGYFILFSALIVTAFVDFEHQIIPDSMWIAIFVGGIFTLADSFIRDGFSKELLISRVIGLFSVALPMFLIGQISGGRAMGGGDVKLMAAVGFMLGWKSTVVSLFIAAFAGVLFAVIRKISKGDKMRGAVPFGPFLAFGTAVSTFFGDALVNNYLSLFAK